ncbi:MAG: TolC family protein [Bacteroidales bacterium]|nr:TolC family protein [Bacteroidales bacterium]
MARVIFKKTGLTLIVLLLWAFPAWAGEPLTLQACRQAAREAGRIDVLQQNAEDNRDAGKKLAQSPYQMKAGAYGHISYQSDTPNPANLTDFPFVIHPVSQFQYHAGFGIALPLYSGGRKKLAAQIDEVDRDLDLLTIDRQAMELDQAVDNLYLSVLLGKTGSEILQSQLQAVTIKLKDVQEAFDAGKVYRNAVLEVEAKIAALEARIAGNDAEVEGAAKALALLTGLEITKDTPLEKPELEALLEDAEDPALASLDLQLRKIELQKEFSRASALPSVKAIGSVGYGQWQLNFFDNNPNFYGIVGVTLQIPISDWRDVSNRNKMLDSAAEALQIRREEADKHKSAALQQFDSQIAKYEALLKGSQETVEKYKALCEELDKLTQQGRVPASDYLTALEQLSSARLDSELNATLILQLRLRRDRFISTL